MKVTDFDYNLPEEKIAKYPPEVRGKSRLLILKKESGEIIHEQYENLDKYLSHGDLLILNDTKVIKARLKAQKENGKEVEIMVLEKHSDKKTNTVMYRGKININDELRIKNYELKVDSILGNGLATLSSEKDLYDLADEEGQTPIPPYMKRESEEIDEKRYQTVFAKEKGSVAAPTASLNFTDELKEKLEAKGIQIAYLTLHVGLGTFMPIRVENFDEHKMHEEFYFISEETVKKILETKQKGNKIIALGTTVTRALEHSANVILSEVEGPISNEADIFIYPGYNFQIVDTLITNFHAPRSTVLMLASAFAGVENLQKAYKEALGSDYRFLSYGDSMLII